MRLRTSAEEYLDQRMADPEYATAYATAARRIEMFDEVVRSLDDRRQELGMTKAELARRSDLPAAAVRRLFSQQHKNPTLTTLIAVADALDLVFCSAPAPQSGDRPVAQVPTALARTRASGTHRRTA